MSLNGIMSAAVSGLQTAQTGLRATSDNVANVDTRGYVRKVVDQSPFIAGGIGVGVKVDQIRLATDRFLQAASRDGTADAARAAAAESLWDQAQGLFGDPSTNSSFFSGLDRVFSGFATLSTMPNSIAARASVIAEVEQFFQHAAEISDNLQAVRDQADARINAGVEKVNTLLTQINDLNLEISRSRILTNDGTGPEQQQISLVEELSKLIDLKVTPRPQGGVDVRASDGMVLAGDGAAQLSYQRSGAVGELSVVTTGGTTQLLGSRLTSGEIKGLLDLRNIELPSVAAQLGELVSQTADQLNRVHNAYSAVPPPNQLSGRNTGLDMATAIRGFSGETTIAILNGTNVLQRRVDIDFDAGSMSVDGGPAAAFTPATFLATLNASLGALGSASFSGGALTLSASAGNGVAVQDDAADPSLKTGRGFSHFFGLNDVARSSTFPHYDTGLQSTDAHGFVPGGQVTFRLTDGQGSRLTDVNFTIPAAGTMNDLVTALNASPGGMGVYGSFSLDADGQLKFAAPAGSGRVLTVVQDLSQRGVGGPNLSTFFGIGEAARAARAPSFSVRPELRADASRLALGQLDLTVPAGATSLAKGDTRGADALSRVGQLATSFDPAGTVGGARVSLTDYASEFGGHIGRKADGAASAREHADAVVAEANARRSEMEGVNLDQELIQLTTYQQAYNASARMIQAVKEMYDVLLGMTN